ncbi:hypothetical protein [Salmonirosea aquatica]|uniref:Anti-sigma factor n=1 Tax=Salmonirosea aquatica TaxID=2654236 RepID=A0A7C9FD86_9BACT|nr:hypothetical protein [Cytophagaceae bacterium SJW1-29]
MKKSFDKKDRLERFVRDNREDFDILEPDDALWGRIAGQLGSEPVSEQTVPLKKTTRPRSWGSLYFDWRIAAGLILAIGISYLAYLNKEFGVTRDPQVALNVPAYAREFTHYNDAIQEKRAELIRLTSDNPELYQEFSTDLDRLEKSYGNLRSELPKAPNQEALIQAMIQNLQWQIDLLNQQLTILQRIKQADKRHENKSII